MLVVVFTFLFIDMFDTAGTLVGVCTKAKMTDENGNIARIKHAFIADSIATTVGAMLGTSTTTTYVESAAGVAQGGRSGLTAFVIGCCFAVALLFSPLFLSIPSAATAPALIIVGLLMLDFLKLSFHLYCKEWGHFTVLCILECTFALSDNLSFDSTDYVHLPGRQIPFPFE